MELTTAYKSRKFSMEDVFTTLANSRAVILDLFVVIKGYKPKKSYHIVIFNESELNVKSQNYASIEHIVYQISLPLRVWGIFYTTSLSIKCCFYSFFFRKHEILLPVRYIYPLGKITLYIIFLNQ